VADLPLACPRCGADMRGGRLSSAVDPSAIVLRWQTVWLTRWEDFRDGQRPVSDVAGVICPEMCGEFVPVREKANG
jgi:hypothetical protein